MRDTDKVVGVNGTGYPQQRNIIDLPFNTWVPIHRFNYLRALNKVVNFRKKYGFTPIFTNSYLDIGIRKPMIYHLINSIPLNNKPFITTFETQLPYWNIKSGGRIKDKYNRFAVERLLSKKCCKLIAISNRAYRSHHSFLQRNFPYAMEMMKKVVVMFPPQKLIADKVHDMNHGEDINFVFVGVRFWGKGGEAIVRAFSKLTKEGMPVKLTIVGMLDVEDKIPERKVSSIKETISTNDRIAHFDKLPNSEVIALLKNSHVGLLPSYVDTFGYSVLEMQAAGLPVITTDVNAFPEINDAACGWVIGLPEAAQNVNDVWKNKNYDQYNEIVEREIYKIVRDVCNDRDILHSKAACSIDRIKKDHDPLKYALYLEGLYDEMLTC